MNDDMKRLCEAAERNLGERYTDIVGGRHGVEAIVRAVLTEMKAIDARHLVPRHESTLHHNGEMLDYTYIAKTAVRIVVDHLLRDE